MRRTAVLALSILWGACSADRSEFTLSVASDTLGDTIVVRTLAGSAWGAPARLVPEVSIGELDGDLEYLFGSISSLAIGLDGTIYVVDQQIPELRAYGPDGTFRAVLASPGEGPGEIKQPDGGLAVLSDGRILVRDPGNARIQVFSPAGEALATWPIRGGFNTSTPMYRDDRDNVYVSALVDPEAEVRDWVIGLFQVHPNGSPGDTLIPPDRDYESPSLEARRDGGVSRTSVPFSPSAERTLSPGGYYIHGISTQYRIDIDRPGGPLRIERVTERIGVAGGEKAEEEARVTRNMRGTQPDWRWNGPAIPDVKPAYRDLFAGADGRIWVQVSAPGIERDDPDYDPKDPDSIEDRWTEPVAFDVFEADGTYLGMVEAPTGFSVYPTPMFDGDVVWATTRDDLGVQRVVRFRTAFGAATEIK